MSGMEKLNAPRRAPRQHIQPNERNVVAWGNGRFDNRKGQASMSNVGLKKYVARFVLVIGVPEHNTSKLCACDRPTDEYLVSFRSILAF
jgi:transposase